MERKITFVFIILFMNSCFQDKVSGRDNMLKNKTYVHLFFETEKECMEAQPDPDFFLNCHQQVDFYEDNVVDIMLSDIMWRGIYSIEGNEVILNFEPSYEIPDGEIRFEILPANKLLHIKHGTVWKKVNGNSIWN